MKRARRRKTAAARRPPTIAPGYAPAIRDGVHATVQTVQDMHHAIADTAFENLQRVPGLSAPTRLVQGVHDAISQGVYAAVRHGSGALMAIAGAAERLATDTSSPAAGKEQTLRSVLNGVFGDALAEAGSSLSVQMGFHRNASPLPITPAALAGLRERVCIFIHGLACDELSWHRGAAHWQGSELGGEHGNVQGRALSNGTPIHYGALLEQGAGTSAIYLRYNTGLPVADNAQQLAEQLEQLLDASPAHVRDLVLIGHSMGGLVARAACELAAADGHRWLGRARLLICLGTPHQGAMLEQWGHLTSRALGLFRVTRPLARIANTRSQGIKDLRHGRRGQDPGETPPPQAPALRFISARLGDESEPLMATLVGKALGDGLVMPASASDDGLVGDVRRVELAGLGHMALLNHPRVYAQLSEWLAESASGERRPSDSR